MSSKSIAGNSLSKKLFGEIILDEISNVELIFTIWILDLVIFTSPNLSPGHLILGKSSSLVGANVVGSSHNLARAQLLDEVVILEHS